MEVFCFSCNKQLELEGGSKVLKNEECPYCYASIHSCKMCKFYDESAYNSCKENQAERIVEKEKANYCDYYVLLGGKDEKEELQDQISAANSLFKD